MAAPAFEAGLVAAGFMLFGVGGFILGYSAGKRAYEDRMPAVEADDLTRREGDDE